jgi:hypothetical protein
MPSGALVSLISIVMYFGLLHARREGQRYAPSSLEMGVVTLLLSGAVAWMPAMFTISGGATNLFAGTVFVVTFYLTSIVVRKLLGASVLRYETGVLVWTCILGIAGSLIFPLLAHG